MEITHLGCKTAVSSLLLIIVALTLTNGAKAASTSKSDPINKVVDDLFANLEGKTAPVLGSEVKDYAAQLQSAITSHLKDTGSHAGKHCSLRIMLAPDGILLNVRPEEGDPALYRAVMKAMINARFPKPPTSVVYDTFKNSVLEFRPMIAK